MPHFLSFMKYSARVSALALLFFSFSATPIMVSSVQAADSVKFGLWVRLEAKPGKEKELENFLTSALPLAEEEKGTKTWYAVRIDQSNYAIFDTFSQKEDRDAHLEGKIAKELMAKASDLLASPPTIKSIDILAAK